VAQRTRAGKPPDRELLRRLYLGNQRKILDYRYGSWRRLPDDDAGREDLVELLKLTPEKGRAWLIEECAGWMDATEAESTLDHVNRMPEWQCEWNPKAVGLRQNVTLQLRADLGLWWIHPCDDNGPVSDEAMAEWRKGRKQERDRRRRACKPREAYIAQSLSKTQPWLADSVSRRTWYRRNGTSMRQTLPSPHPTEVFASIVRSGLHIGGWNGARLSLKALLLTLAQV
jgi:hypothetical protein